MNHAEEPPVQQIIHNNIKTTTGPFRNSHRARQTPYPDPTTIRRSARIQAQRANSRNDNNTNNNPRHLNTDQQKSTINISIAEHQKQTGHQMDWEGFKIVYQETHKQKLLLKESLVVKACNTSSNKAIHSVPL